jgi:glycosyltransferase involved in cell wall biosynthesis
MNENMNKPFVSVIIPVFNDGQRLDRCLEALERQTYPANRFDVIVVDNGSREDPAGIVGRYGHAKLARQAKPSSYAARNTGIAMARGDVLAFTDSDCLPDARWIEAGVAALLGTPDCGLVGGAVEVFCADESRPTAVEVFERVTAFPQERYLRDYHYAVTANVFTWRQVMEQVGTFKDKLKSSGDNEWGNRVHAAGLKQVYCAEARVRHPARRTFREIYRKTVRLVHGQRDWKGPESVTLRQIFTDLRPPIGMIWRALNDRRLRGFSEKLAFIIVNTFMRNVRGMTRMKIWIRDRMRPTSTAHALAEETVEPQATS